MNQDDSPRRHQDPSSDPANMIAANMQWHDAELAMKMARLSFDRWLAGGPERPPSSAIMHAYHTHEALHETARTITTLIETFNAEVIALRQAREQSFPPVINPPLIPGAEGNSAETDILHRHKEPDRQHRRSS